MQNIAVVNTELKSPSISNKASDVSASNTETKADSLFGETLSAELKKAETNHVQANAKRDAESQKSDAVEPKQQTEVKKAEKETVADGNELPVTSKLTEKSSEEIISVESLDNELIEQTAINKVQTETKSTSPTNTAVSVPTDQAVDEEKQSIAKSNIHLEDDSSQVALKSTTQIEQPKFINETAVSASSKASENKLNQAAITTVNQLSEGDSVSTKLKGEAEPLSKNSDVTNSQHKNVISSQAESVEKELVIKQINIAKEAVAKTDNSQEKLTIAVPEQKVDKTDVKLTKPVISDAELLTETEQKKAKTAQPTTSKISDIPLKQVDVEAATSSNQREAVVLDKKAVQLVDPTPVRTNKLDKKVAIASAPLTNMASQVVQSTSASVPPVLDIQPGLKTEAWERVMAGRVVWMAREGLQRADLKLNPANMGPIEVRLTINNDQANVSFVVNNPATREAIEQSLPRLREGFQANGLSLESADVSDQTLSQEQEREQYQQAGSGILFSSDVDDELDTEALVIEKNTDSGLSLYV
jgi:flagellar hook-length control protein FliK